MHIQLVTNMVQNDAVEILASDRQDLTFNQASSVFLYKNNHRSPKYMDCVLGPDGRFTGLALLISDQCPWRYEVRSSLGTATISGSIIKQAIDVPEKILEIRRIIAEEEGTPLKRIPSIALNEVILNSIAHRDYGSEMVTSASIREHSVSVVSPGGLFCSGLGRTRNPGLSKIIGTIGLKNNLVRGLEGVINSYRSS